MPCLMPNRRESQKVPRKTRRLTRTPLGHLPYTRWGEAGILGLGLGGWLVCAALLLVLTAPVMLLVALAIKLESPGPVLFAQERVGLNGRVFTLFKFRSMRQDAERNGPVWALERQPRAGEIWPFRHSAIAG